MTSIERYSVLSEKLQKLSQDYSLYEIIFALSDLALLDAKKIRSDDKKQNSWNKFKVLLTCLDGLSEAAKMPAIKKE